MSYHVIQAKAERLPLADASVDLVIGSPPYLDARTYLEDGKDLGIARKCQAWVEWMIGVTEECLRVSRGLVIWVCAGKTEDWTYQPGPEGLLYEWWNRGGSAFRPCYWHRVGIPGSGGEQWYRADVEYVLAFKRPGKLPYGNPTANGHPPKWAPGGEMSHRMSDGKRVNAFGVRMDGVRIGGRRQSGKKYTEETPDHNSPDLAVSGRKVQTRDRPGMHSQESTFYAEPALANPGTLLHTNAGGGHSGSKLAHLNEAPYSVEVPKFFVNSHCPPGGTVLDPFSGSGSTGDAAIELGRNYIGCDLRMSQCRLTRKRLRGVTPGFTFAEEL